MPYAKYATGVLAKDALLEDKPAVFEAVATGHAVNAQLGGVIDTKEGLHFVDQDTPVFRFE